MSIIAIAGPTAAGKTFFAVKYALSLYNNFGIKSEIINADSIQLYNELKIITAYPSELEIKQVTHSLYGILSPYDLPTVAFWLSLVEERITQLRKEGKTAILCGGTGFYINAITNGISEIPEIPKNIRESVFKRFKEIGREAFFEELTNLDPNLVKNLHKNNTQRILRAYEVVTYTRKPLSEWWKEGKKSKYKVKAIFLSPSRVWLYEKCAARINIMMENGAVDEVKDFMKRYPNYDGGLCNAIGYREIESLLNGKISKSECVESMLIKTKQYAKRQSTWFRNQLKTTEVISDIDAAISDL